MRRFSLGRFVRYYVDVAMPDQCIYHAFGWFDRHFLERFVAGFGEDALGETMLEDEERDASSILAWRVSITSVETMADH